MDDCIGSVFVEFQFVTKSYVFVFPCIQMQWKYSFQVLGVSFTILYCILVEKSSLSELFDIQMPYAFKTGINFAVSK